MITFFVIGLATWLMAAVVVAAYMHVILAVLVGLAAGFVVGVAAGLAVLVWPVVRVIWHWLPEIALTVGLLAGLTWLASVIPAQAAIISLAVVIGGLMAYPVTRRAVIAAAWCLISRHRLRVCFSAFLAGNRDGSLPLILIAKPTPVGERIWVWLRPGLSLADLQDRGDQIAVACWASETTIARASARYAALLRFDVKRRNTLTGVVTSPLVGDLPDAPERDTPKVSGDITALDLPGVPAEAVTEPEPAKPARKPAAAKPEPAKAPVPAVVGADGTDVSDWI